MILPSALAAYDEVGQWGGCILQKDPDQMITLTQKKFWR